jgi:hypothetical protein
VDRKRVICINKCNPVTVSLFESMEDGGLLSLVFRMCDELKPAVLLQILLAYDPGIIRAAIIHENDLQIREGLTTKAFKAAF